MRAFYGNFGMMVRAYTYIREMGARRPAAGERHGGAQRATTSAARSKDASPCAVRHARACTRSCSPIAHLESETGVKTLDVAKRLIDYGFHPPTVYFPLVVRGALMIEPTETETKQTLDAFVDAMLDIQRRRKRTRSW